MQTRLALCVTAVLLLSACEEDEPAQSPQQPVVEQPESPGIAAPEAQEAPDEDVAAPGTPDHFTEAGAAHAALIRGELDAVKERMEELAVRLEEGDLPEPWSPHVDEMRRGALEVANAGDIETAARSFGLLAANTCGACHASMGRGPVFSAETPPEATDTQGHMRRHRWAAERMWEGLIEPSEEMFARGAAASVDVPLHPASLTEGERAPDAVRLLATRVHELGPAAQRAQNVEARAEAYGAFLATCSACHQLVGRGPPADSPTGTE